MKRSHIMRHGYEIIKPSAIAIEPSSSAISDSDTHGFSPIALEERPGA